MAAYQQILADNVAAVREQMAGAALRSGRQPGDVTLVAVTKYVDADVTRCLTLTGCHALGESRPQTLWEKAAALVDVPIQWHLIGHLQRNKIRRTLPVVSWIHSADSERLLDGLQEESLRVDHHIRVLLEVNISGDPAKTGLTAQQAMELASRLEQWHALEICGLMAMSGVESSPAQARREFAQVRALRDRMQRECADNILLSELSLGMSEDFAIAIEEGATLVRVGSALFKGIDV